jgi:CheY-like chemotaxis protein
MKGMLDSVGFVLRNSLSQHHHVLTTKLDPPDLCIESDAQWIAQILVNLVSNAIKFTPPSGQILVSAVAQPEHEVMKLSVSDSGIGIAANDLQRIFQPFVRLARGHQGDPTGCGIGLSLIARMAAALGGRVDVQSTPGAGSTFTVTLPLGRPPAVAPLPSKTSPLTSTSGLFVASVDLHVLIIDDNQSNIDTLRPYLESKGWMVTASTDPVASLSKIEDVDARVLVLDIQMPLLDGYEVARRIRAHPSPNVSNLPILALSALSGLSAERHAREAGCTLHIEKPSRLSFIEGSLRRLVIDSLVRRDSKAVQSAPPPA